MIWLLTTSLLDYLLLMLNNVLNILQARVLTQRIPLLSIDDTQAW